MSNSRVSDLEHSRLVSYPSMIVSLHGRERSIPGTMDCLILFGVSDEKRGQFMRLNLRRHQPEASVPYQSEREICRFLEG